MAGVAGDTLKQFVALVDERSTFQQVLSRIGGYLFLIGPWVLTNSDFRFVVAEQMRECAVEGDIVLEPMRRDSAMAVAVAAVLAARRDPAATLLILAADHVVSDQVAFSRACREAVSAAATGRIVTFGVKPTFPATKYGYIQPGSALNGSAVLTVELFVESHAATASRYIADHYLWNSGNFVFRADVMLGEFMKFEPDIARAAGAAVDGMTRDPRLPARSGRRLRRGPEEIHRSCRDGAHQSCGSDSGRLWLVRYR